MALYGNVLTPEEDMEKEKDIGRSKDIRMIWLAYIIFFPSIHSLESYAYMEIPLVLCEEFLPTLKSSVLSVLHFKITSIKHFSQGRSSS